MPHEQKLWPWHGRSIKEKSIPLLRYIKFRRRVLGESFNFWNQIWTVRSAWRLEGKAVSMSSNVAGQGRKVKLFDLEGG